MTFQEFPLCENFLHGVCVQICRDVGVVVRHIRYVEIKELRKGEKASVYFDKGYSGKNTDRPEFQRLLEDIRLGTVNKVVCYKLDRVSRSVVDFAMMMETFARYKVDFVSCNE